jgi:hypothetical protein
MQKVGGNSNASDLYLGIARFELRSGYRNLTETFPDLTNPSPQIPEYYSK